MRLQITRHQGHQRLERAPSPSLVREGRVGGDERGEHLRPRRLLGARNLERGGGLEMLAEARVSGAEPGRYARVTGGRVPQPHQDPRRVGVAPEGLQRRCQRIEEPRVAGPLGERGGERHGRLFVAAPGGAEEPEPALLLGAEAAHLAQGAEGADGVVVTPAGFVEIGELGQDARVPGGELDRAHQGAHRLGGEIELGAREAQLRERLHALGRGQVGRGGLTVGAFGLPGVARLGVEPAAGAAGSRRAWGAS